MGNHEITITTYRGHRKGSCACGMKFGAYVGYDGTKVGNGNTNRMIEHGIENGVTAIVRVERS